MPDEKRIIIDEDWKSQVEAEREAAKKPHDAPGSTTPGAQPSDPGDVPMPPASFEMLLTSLATEALVALGQVPHPATQQFHVHRPQAKYLIDTIDVLRQKTQGNLTPDEQRTIEALLHQLRMAFLESAGAPSAGPVEPGSGS